MEKELWLTDAEARTMNSLDATVFEDAESLKEWLAENGLVPYADFELLTVTLSDGALEIDPMGNQARLLTYLRRFALLWGYRVQPFDPETGSISLLKAHTSNQRRARIP